MSNVFISHSSHDKKFVRKLATALLSEGFPVWLDSWKIELGDSLYDEIYEGIETSSVVLFVISKKSIESGWVKKELNAALAKEDHVGRKFVIPIKIDNCSPPIQILDRIYADFSSSFSEPLAVLVNKLAKEGCRDFKVAPERELISLSFSKEVHLDINSLNKAIRHIERRQGRIILNANQVVFNDDHEYTILLKKLHEFIDNITSSPFFSPSLESYARETLDVVREREKYLAEGVALLITNGCASDAIFWFAKMVRGMNAYSLWSVQRSDAPDNLEYGRQWSCATLCDNYGPRTFFETKNVEGVHIWSEANYSDTFSLWIDSEEVSKLFVDNRYNGPQELFSVCGPKTVDKYIYPQMVFQYLNGNRKGMKIIWNLNNAMIGLR